MQVTITNVNVEWNGVGAKKWGKAVVDYSVNGKQSARPQNVVSFSNPAVFKQVQELVGHTVEVDIGKNDKGYDEWRSISVNGVGSPSSTGSSPSTVQTKESAVRVSGSNYETREERAARQVLIVKQSSLSAAVASLAPGAKSALTTEEVLKRAQEFTDFVFDEGNEGTIDNV